MLCVLRLVKAWPHDCLFHLFWSSAGPAEVRQVPTGRQFGSRVVQVWPKDRPKRPLLEKRGTWPKHNYLSCFRAVGMDFGKHWAAQGRPWRPYWMQRGPLCQHRGTRVQLGSMETVGNGRKRTETDANGCKRMETNPNSSRIRGQNLFKGQDI